MTVNTKKLLYVENLLKATYRYLQFRSSTVVTKPQTNSKPEEAVGWGWAEVWKFLKKTHL